MQSSSQVPLCTAKAVALCGIIASAGLPLSKAEAWNSELLGYNSTTGALTYNTVDGYRLPDFGFAGYRYGAPLPMQIPRPTSVAALVTTNDTTDRTEDIQKAIDAVGLLPVQANGYRGMVLLGAGTFYVKHSIYLNKSGVVLSGAGPGTILRRPLIADTTGLAPAKASPEQRAPVVIIGNVFNIGNDGQPTATRWAGGGSSGFAVARYTYPNGTAITDSTKNSMITDAKVPVGATSFHISASDARRYTVGDKICLVNKPTKDWLASVNHGGMSTDSDFYWGNPKNKDTGILTTRYLREITNITPGSTGGDTTITIDAPIFMDLLRPANPDPTRNSPCFIYKSNYKGESALNTRQADGTWKPVGTVSYSGNKKQIDGYDVMVENCGLQNLLIDIDHQEGTFLLKNKDGTTTVRKYETHANDAVRTSRVQDCWVRGITARGFIHSGVQVGDDSIRCTVQNCTARDPYNNFRGGQGYNFGTYKAQLVLFDKCYAHGGRHNLVNGGFALDSGIVFRDCHVDAPRDSSEAHMGWTNGILVEGMTTSGTWGNSRNILAFHNRGRWGGSKSADGTSYQGHGWAAANCVAWRCDFTNQADPTVSGKMYCQKPPTAQNFAIGCKGWITMAQTTRPYGKEENEADWENKSINAKNPEYTRTLADFLLLRRIGPGHIEPRGGPGTGDDIDHRYTAQEAKYKAGTTSAAVSLTPLTTAAQNAAFDTLEPRSLYEAQRNVANKIYQTESLALSTGDTTATVTPGTYTDDSGVLGTNVTAAPNQTVTFMLPHVLVGHYRVFVGVKSSPGRGRFTLHTADSPTASFATKPVGTVDTYAALDAVSELEVGKYDSGSVNSKKFKFTYTPTTSSNGLTLDYIRLQRLY